MYRKNIAYIGFSNICGFSIQWGSGMCLPRIGGGRCCTCHTYVGYIPKSGIAGCGYSASNGFTYWCTNLHSHQQSIGVLIFSPAVNIDIFILLNLAYVCVSISLWFCCIFLITNEGPSIFSFFIGHLDSLCCEVHVKSFAYISSEKLVLWLLLSRSFWNIVNIICQVHVLQISSCGLTFQTQWPFPVSRISSF